MRHLIMPLLTAAALVLSTVPAYADLGDQLFKLLTDDGAAEDDFGFSVAISGFIAIVGARGDDDNGASSGSAYIFDTQTGEQIVKLVPGDNAAIDNFGWSVAISGTTAIVGALGDDDNGDNSGSAYLFDISDPQNPVEIAKLLANDGAAGDFFGVSVAISGATAIVGAWEDNDNGTDSGSAYLFDATTGLQIAKLLPEDGETRDSFGVSVAINGSAAVVGAYHDDDTGTDSGSAYLFDISDSANPVQTAKLLADDRATGDIFGRSVAISGATAIVGAELDDDNGSASGSAYLFNIATGQQIAKLLPDDGATQDSFGVSVAISGTTAIVGAIGDDVNGAASGSTYLFDTTTGQQIAKLLPGDGAGSDEFGWSVAISGPTGMEVAIVGAHFDGDNGSLSGSAYVFDAGARSGMPAELTDLTVIDGFIVSGGLPEIVSSDDMYLETESLVTGKAAETHRMLMRIRAMTAVQKPTSMGITLEAHITDIEASVALFLKNFQTGDFEQVGQFTNGLANDTVNTITVVNAGRFVRPNGRIVLRLKKIVILPFTLNGFHSLEDLLEIVVR